MFFHNCNLNFEQKVPGLKN